MDSYFACIWCIWFAAKNLNYFCLAECYKLMKKTSKGWWKDPLFWLNFNSEIFLRGSRVVKLYPNYINGSYISLHAGLHNLLHLEWEKMERELGNGYIQSLHFLMFSLFPPSLSISYVKYWHILSQNVKYGTVIANATKIILNRIRCEEVPQVVPAYLHEFHNKKIWQHTMIWARKCKHSTNRVSGQIEKSNLEMKKIIAGPSFSNSLVSDKVNIMPQNVYFWVA